MLTDDSHQISDEKKKKKKKRSMSLFTGNSSKYIIYWQCLRRFRECCSKDYSLMNKLIITNGVTVRTNARNKLHYLPCTKCVLLCKTLLFFFFFFFYSIPPSTLSSTSTLFRDMVNFVKKIPKRPGPGLYEYVSNILSLPWHHNEHRSNYFRWV